MLSKDIVAQPLSTEWAVIKWDANVRKDVKASGLVHPSLLEKATLVSDLRYIVDKTKRSFEKDSNVFERQFAQGSFGYLIGSYQEEYSKVVYRVVPSSDFIGLWADQQEAIRKLEEEEEARRERMWQAEQEMHKRQALREERVALAKEVSADRTTKAINAVRSFMNRFVSNVDSTVSIQLVANVKDVGDDRFEPAIGGVVSMNADAIQELMQSFMDLQEQVKSRG